MNITTVSTFSAGKRFRRYQPFNFIAKSMSFTAAPVLDTLKVKNCICENHGLRGALPQEKGSVTIFLIRFFLIGKT